MKQLDRNGLQGNKEFLAEVLTLSLVHHPNLVNLIGYCADGRQRILVYDFMPNGSLEDHLFGIISTTTTTITNQSLKEICFHNIFFLFFCFFREAAKKGAFGLVYKDENSNRGSSRT